jgi:hypothetical protein
MKHNYTQGFESPEAFIPFLVIRRRAVGRLSDILSSAIRFLLFSKEKPWTRKKMTSRIQNNVILPPRMNA